MRFLQSIYVTFVPSTNIIRSIDAYEIIMVQAAVWHKAYFFLTYEKLEQNLFKAL